MKGETARNFNEQLKKEIPTYKRDSYQTFLTAPEWRNVDMAVEMASFLRNGNAFYKYPYFKQILTFWYIFVQSLRAANAHHSLFKLIFSQYTLMNAFIGVWTTVECVLKGIISIPFWLLLKGKNDTAFQQHVANLHKEYSDFIHHTPFFMYSYADKILSLLQAYFNSDDKSACDLATLFMTSIELLVRTVPSLPSRLVYGQPGNTQPEKIHVMVKHDKALGEFGIEELNQVNMQSVKTLEKIKNNKSIDYTDVELTRYMQLKSTLLELSKQRDNIKIKFIAGNDKILVDFVANEEIKANLGKVLYSYSNHIDQRKFYAIEVATKELLNAINTAEKNNITTKFVHDF